jgi:hypothetical protein
MNAVGLMLRRLPLVASLILTSSVAANAQVPGNAGDSAAPNANQRFRRASAAASGAAQSGWRWATEGSAERRTGSDLPEGTWRFTEMAPGWHITTRPASLTVDSVRFSVNGARGAALPVATLPLEGRFGFRTGENLDLHVTTLNHTRALAPARTR